MLNGVCFGTPALGAEQFWDLSGSNAVLRISITIPSEQVEALRKAPREFVAGLLEEGGKRYAQVGVHLKGNGTFQPIDKRPSFTLKFNKFVVGQRFRGLHKLLLHHCSMERTLLNEYLGSEMFRLAGLPAPIVHHALVSLNGKTLGLYVAVEGETKDFLRRYFDDDSGNLYEGERADINSPKIDQDSGTSSNREDLRALVTAVQETIDHHTLAPLERVLDVERFIRFMAMEVMLDHFDGYSFRTNNYRIYHDTCSGKMVFIPHGLDTLFGNPYKTAFPEMRGMVSQAVMSTEEGTARYRQTIEDIYAKVLDDERVRRELLKVSSCFEPLIRELDPKLADVHKSTLNHLLIRIRDRRTKIEEELRSSAPTIPLR